MTSFNTHAGIAQDQLFRPLAVTSSEAAWLLGCSSRQAFQREARELGLIPYRRGKYRVRDIEHCLALAARRANERAARAKAK